ncbi:MAG: tetratricopeptide repeat protein [Terriglobales bacterium]
MLQEPKQSATSKLSWQPRQLMVMCAVCLAAGFLAGYFLRGSASVGAPAASVTAQTPAAASRPMGESAGPSSMPQQISSEPTLDDLKRMADKKASPLLAKLESDPKNPQLWNQVGLIFKSAHQFKEASGYFENSLKYDPKNLGVRADYASCLYYTGDVDGALAQLNQSLAYDPKHAGTLMNIGIIKWRGKNDVDGAVAAWEKLLQYHPEFPQKDMVQRMITQAKQSRTANAGLKG